MRRLCLLLPLLVACSSDKYVHITATDGRSFYAKREDTEKADKYGMINVENVLTGKRVMLRLSDCMIRSASRAEVTRARGNNFVYDK